MQFFRELGIASKLSPPVLPIAAVAAAMACFQLGAALAKGLFPAVGADGAAALRLGIAAAILLAVWRPWPMRFTRKELRNVVVYGVAMGFMNLCFYRALRYIPLGVAVALELAGPLSLAMLASRRTIDFLWILLAAVSLTGLLPLGGAASRLPLLGVAFALLAGACWALYIVFGRRAGTTHGGRSTALGTLVGALVIVPIGLTHNGMRLLAPALLPAALGVAVLSSALPYSLEMFALPRIPARTFGVLMSLNPAVGALSGLFFLGESLSLLQWAAIAGVVTASAGSAATRDAMR